MTAGKERSEGIARVERDRKAFQDKALVGLLDVCLTRGKGKLLTSEDVWTVLGKVDWTMERRAMGPVFANAARLSWIKPTGKFVPGKRASRHAAPIRQWRIMINE